MKIKKQKKKSFLIMDIAIVLLTLVLCFLGFAFYIAWSEAHSPAYSEAQILRELSEKDYGLAIRWKQAVEHGTTLEQDENFAHAAALCDYIEADYFRPVYEKEGNEAGLLRIKEQKEKAEQNIGPYNTLLSQIDELFSD